MLKPKTATIVASCGGDCEIGLRCFCIFMQNVKVKLSICYQKVKKKYVFVEKCLKFANFYIILQAEYYVLLCKLPNRFL